MPKQRIDLILKRAHIGQGLAQLYLRAYRRRAALEQASSVFTGGKSETEAPVDLKALHAKNGELTLENDFLEVALIKAGMLSAKRRSTRVTIFRSLDKRNPSNSGGRAAAMPNEARALDITYTPMARGFVYFVGIMDWRTRKLLSFRLSTTLTADFCVEALEEPIGRFGRPEIVNTDQGSQFTSAAFVELVHRHGIALSMDGPRVRGRTTSSSSASGGP